MLRNTNLNQKTGDIGIPSLCGLQSRFSFVDENFPNTLFEYPSGDNCFFRLGILCMFADGTSLDWLKNERPVGNSCKARILP